MLSSNGLKLEFAFPGLKLSSHYIKHWASSSWESSIRLDATVSYGALVISKRLHV